MCSVVQKWCLRSGRRQIFPQGPEIWKRSCARYRICETKPNSCKYPCFVWSFSNDRMWAVRRCAKLCTFCAFTVGAQGVIDVAGRSLCPTFAEARKGIVFSSDSSVAAEGGRNGWVAGKAIDNEGNRVMQLASPKAGPPLRFGMYGRDVRACGNPAQTEGAQGRRSR